MIAVWVATWTGLPHAWAGDYSARRHALRNLDWVLLEVINLHPERDDRDAFTASLKKDIGTTFWRAGVKIRITENKSNVMGATYLRIRVHKIRLERTVFLSVVSLVAGDDITAVGAEKEAIAFRYTNISNVLEAVRPKIGERLSHIVEWYIE